ncbi:MAG: tRNA (adenosine(37)-N6)-threonylcarbamoyltransferase complex transferase subunit TsaD [Bdellovibrionales bacterium]|jgi:N6-L-threonylcarbamoyladenine synthase|nr:tRNA (adenosine(37)-N6)-threonylcarbamoyltransferase complex transferase subunit TsaD [Bdellovibrionales bacterium]MBT3525853.1 tRNA (adenosine(37)-N6)-threonylcarbamoyltransferase complex transferase subunit TsaD [Bdellovibrionales bacterium]MBT7766589.1 tRNA (adenosine(37)-N6)-threonylcarbamoyltransferase complex transferase subunit TsaD [Bdellovibrionales bacterium]
MSDQLIKSELVLGIETSCDDTSMAIIRTPTGGANSFPEILAHDSFSSEMLLAAWGGVVPEIAARSHLEKIPPLLSNIFSQTNLTSEQIDLIGVTTHPGLLGPLLTGLNVAKTLSLFDQTPVVPVNHLYAHLEAIHLDHQVEYPYLGLLVSGGHSLFLLAHAADNFQILGSTIDDAAGEAFDKGGKILGLDYPAGRMIDQLAQRGDPHKFKFPIGLKGSGDAILSFSGVKTSLKKMVTEHPEYLEMVPKNTANQPESYPLEFCHLVASYQHGIISALILKLKFAVKQAIKISGRDDLPIVVGGGVACNSLLRQVITDDYPNSNLVNPSYCTDNGAMVANYALRIKGQADLFPQSLELDAASRFINKKRTSIQ